LTQPLPVPHLFSMVRTLKDAWHAGWRIRVRCYVFGPHHKAGWRDHVICDHSTELDLKTLVWTRGNLPLAVWEKKLRCPRCGNMRIQVIYEIPNQPNANRIA
jgi:hypothetical protein